ncbi:ectin-like isoform X1 [Hydractinia symbiolongicarpus]|uniref:ectin-like isoform X1 n=1 Tax=Hydractinia symbiolongicarpus TaxID=13093 RepID=UPI00254C807C|nr:ectin-like isoform X1 [Hydractinia symbiolongicarpus]
MASKSVNERGNAKPRLSKPERPMRRRTREIDINYTKIRLKTNEVLEIYKLHLENSASLFAPYSGRSIPVTKPIYVSEDRDACLYAHNKLRSYHGVPTLEWDHRLAKDAKNWAIYLMETGFFDHDSCYPDGENLYEMPWDTTFKRAYDAVFEFYNEIHSYDFAHPALYENDENKFEKIGHFSQLIWKDTKKVGCCLAYDKASTRTVIVCRYNVGQGYDFINEIKPQIKNSNGGLYVPQLKDLICENDVKPTLIGVSHYCM